MNDRSKVLIAVVVLCVIGAVSVSRRSVQPVASNKAVEADIGQAAAPNADSYVPYEIVDAWNLGLAIVVDPKHRNEKDLILLTRQLQRGARSKTHWLVRVFDDAEAARRHRESLVDDVQLAKHHIALYIRNTTTGIEELTLMLGGLNGPFKKIDLQ